MGQRGQLDRLPVAHSGPVMALDWCNAPSSITKGATGLSDGLGWIVSGGLDRCVKVSHSSIFVIRKLIVMYTRYGTSLQQAPIHTYLIKLLTRCTLPSPFAVSSGVHHMNASLPSFPMKSLGQDPTTNSFTHYQALVFRNALPPC